MPRVRAVILASRISARVRVSVSIVLGLATEG